jgi:Flp pilus assembly secretin CpaC
MKGLQNVEYSLILKQLCAVSLALTLSAQDVAFAAPATGATNNSGTNVAAAMSGTRDPLIEVSVDSLEISENNANVLGILWGDSLNPTGNEINFLERSIPSLFNVGSLDRRQIAGKLSALIRNNQVRILANPTLLTKSGFEASFLVGGEIPYPQVGQGGVTGVDYKKYGVNLKILPQLTPHQTIDAQINVSVSNPDSSVAITIQGTNVPGLASREASTKVDVKDGETVVIAGIKQSRRQKVVTRVPILGYIPILGLLFRHKDEQTTQTSLVLFVTFRLLKGDGPPTP